MEPRYASVENRKPDHQYKDALRRILNYGEVTKSRFQTEGTLTSLTVPAMNFYFQNGFPILTERKIGFWRRPINELFAFVNGVTDARELEEKWGVKWWRESWATAQKCATFGLPDGDLGPGSYGAAFAKFPTADGGTFNQFEHLMKQIARYPELRTHKITSWIPQYCLQHDELQRKVVVAPCHGDIQITILNGKLTLRMDQRSADFPIGVPSNTIQYAALTLAIAHLTGTEPHLFIHACHDSQIYLGHQADVEELLKRESRPFPTLRLTEEGKRLTSLFEFRAEHFELDDYDPHPAMTLAAAVV
jgi:thymidylate synthase